MRPSRCELSCWNACLCSALCNSNISGTVPASIGSMNSLTDLCVRLVVVVVIVLVVMLLVVVMMIVWAVVVVVLMPCVA